MKLRRFCSFKLASPTTTSTLLNRWSFRTRIKFAVSVIRKWWKPRARLAPVSPTTGVRPKGSGRNRPGSNGSASDWIPRSCSRKQGRWRRRVISCLLLRCCLPRSPQIHRTSISEAAARCNNSKRCRSVRAGAGAFRRRSLAMAAATAAASAAAKRKVRGMLSPVRVQVQRFLICSGFSISSCITLVFLHAARSLKSWGCFLPTNLRFRDLTTKRKLPWCEEKEGISRQRIRKWRPNQFSHVAYLLLPQLKQNLRRNLVLPICFVSSPPLDYWSANA